jgi:acyl carrier protein
MQPPSDLIIGETVTHQSNIDLAVERTQAERALAELIIASLQLEVTPEDIAPEARLFGEGLGLDSIDALELALAISRTYGFELRSDDERNRRIFASLRSLSSHIEAHRTK